MTIHRSVPVLLALLLTVLLLCDSAPAADGPLAPHPEVQAILTRGLAALRAGKLEEAETAFQEATEKARVLGNRRAEAKLLSAIGTAYASLREFSRALPYLEQALPMLRSMKDRKPLAQTLTVAALAYSETGDSTRALTCCGEALPLLKASGDRRGEAMTLLAAGNAHRNLGEPHKAFASYQQALAIGRLTRERAVEGNALGAIGNFYGRIGQPLQGLDFGRRALAVFEALEDQSNQAQTVRGMAGCLLALGRLNDAERHLERELVIRRALGQSEEEAVALENLAACEDHAGRPDRAREYWVQARAKRATSSRADDAGSLRNRAILALREGQIDKAHEYLRGALKLARDTGDRPAEADILTVGGFLSLKLRDMREAESALRDAATLMEGIRTGLGGRSEAGSRFLATYLEAYYGYMYCLLVRDDVEGAFAVAQKTKSRTLLDLLAAGRVELGRGLTPQERTQERELRLQCERLNEKMVAEGVKNEVGSRRRFEALKEQLERAERVLASYTDALYVRHPKLSGTRAAATTTLARLAGSLPPDTALFEYVCVRSGAVIKGLDGYVLLFVVTSDGGRAKVQAFDITSNDADLARGLGARVAAFRAACARPDGEYREAAQDLSSLLVAPAANQLAGKKRLIICPDGILWDLPFAALLTAPDPDTHSPAQFLAERFEIDYAYSATALQAAVRGWEDRGPRPGLGSILVVANPDFTGSKRFGDPPGLKGVRPIEVPARRIKAPRRPIEVPARPIDVPSRGALAAARSVFVPRGERLNELPGTQREADLLRRSFPGAAVYTGARAQEATAKREAGKYRYLHFATHGFVNDAAPLLSSIVLAQPRDGEEDGFLTAREIFDLDLHAELVVLSACNTARGEQRSGEGIVGLTWAFFAAGAPTQVVSQWSVDDASTAKLMARFYEELQRGRGKGEALRAASVALMQDGKHRHPYYWAPFALMGDWQ